MKTADTTAIAVNIPTGFRNLQVATQHTTQHRSLENLQITNSCIGSVPMCGYLRHHVVTYCHYKKIQVLSVTFQCVVHKITFKNI